MAKKQFKAESKRLLDLMINSIYTNKEIFLRELISNASDAIDKLYYSTIKGSLTGVNREDFYISIETDKENRTVTVEDNGCGMSDKEMEENLGIIAKSGSGDFKKNLNSEGKEGEEHPEIDIIGQFGVGFYSAFMVSDKVTVLSRPFGEEKVYKWESAGAEGYTVEEADPGLLPHNGTKIVMTIKENSEAGEFDEFLESYTLRTIVKKYSDYIRYPIKMETEKSRLKEGTGTEEVEAEYESYSETDTVNSMVPLWKRNKNELTEEDYNSFYRDKFYDYMPPARVIHSNAEGVVTYNSLMFIPKTAPFNYYTKDFEKGLQLYASGVLIMDKCGDLLPDYFGFVRGLVDSQDLSLNISREMLQQDGQLKTIASRIEKKIKSELSSMLKNEREEYDRFFENFGLQLKYGIYSDFGQHKDVLSDLIMFYSSVEKKPVTLNEYVERMKEDQKFIYYATGESIDKIDKLPQTEYVKEEGFEILYCTDDIDEFALKMLGKYNEKEFKSISAGDLGFDKPEDKAEESEADKELFAYMTTALEGKVKAVRRSKRLKSHPVCLSSDGELSLEMEKVLNALPNDQKVKAEKVLEINETHPLYPVLTELLENDKDKLKTYSEILYNQALLIEGLPIEDPVAFSNSICSLMSEK